jgi:hypothetical protein
VYHQLQVPMFLTFMRFYVKHTDSLPLSFNRIQLEKPRLFSQFSMLEVEMSCLVNYKNLHEEHVQYLIWLLMYGRVSVQHAWCP